MSPPVPSFVNHALAARLEAVEVAQIASLAEVVAARLPAQGAAALSVAGGVAVFLARHLSLSRACGLGRSGPVSAADVEALDQFYRSRGTDARVLVSPFADPSLFEQLGARGFSLLGLDTILTCRIDPTDRSGDAGGIEITVTDADDAAVWVAASLAGFGATEGAQTRERAAIYDAAFAVPGTTYFLASIDGAPAGAGALHVHGRTAYLFAASTIAERRGRGVQAALIEARLARAREAGCDLAFTGTGAGTGSQRNFERAGFAPVYSQGLLIKRFGTS